MLVFLRVAWRNAFRNRRRALITSTAVVVGIFGLLATAALYHGMLDGMVSSVVRTQLGHIQVHRRGFHDNPIVEMAMEPNPAFREWLQVYPGIKAWAERVRASGLFTNPEHSTGVQINGIDPERESRVTIIKDSIVEGRYLEAGESGAIIVGKTLKEDFGLRVGSKVVVMAQGRNREIGQAAFRVVGIYDTGMKEYDRYQVYIPIEDAQKLLSLELQISEVVILVSRGWDWNLLKNEIEKKLGSGDYEVLSWQEAMPIFQTLVELFKQSQYIIYVIILIAMATGIVNTMLMTVMERTREFGVLLALGLRPAGIIIMVLLEALVLGAVSAGFGTAFSIGVVAFLREMGIDLSILSAGMEYWRMGKVIYPRLEWEDVLEVNIFALGIATLVSLYPALRAARLQPVQALKHH